MTTTGSNVTVIRDLRSVTFRYCHLWKIDGNSLYLTKCITGTTLGIFSAFIFPIFAIIALITNSLFMYVFFKNKSSMPRHMIYMICVTISSTMTDIIAGWLWLFPSRGLPYITNGRVYFSLIFTSLTSCRFQRFIQSFASTSVVNLLVLSAVDRCLAIKMPIKFSKIQPHHAWLACSAVFISSFIMMLPFGIVVTWHRVNDMHFCWVDPSDHFLHAYHTLFSNFGPIQTIILLFLNLTFLLFIRKYLRNRFLHQCTSNTQSINRKEIRICMLNLILSSSYIAISLPQAVCILLARMPLASMTRIHRMIAYDIGHLMWSLNSVREIADFVVYAIYFKPLTDLLSQFYGNFTLFYYRCLKHVTTKSTTGGDSNTNNVTDYST